VADLTATRSAERTLSVSGGPPITPGAPSQNIVIFSVACLENETRITPRIPKVSLGDLVCSLPLNGVFHGTRCAVAHEHPVVAIEKGDTTRPRKRYPTRRASCTVIRCASRTDTEITFLEGDDPDMKKLLCITSAFLTMAGAGFAGDRTWTGTITDTMCAKSHQSNIEHARQNGGRNMTDQECTVGCVMHRGQRYVLVAGGKTYQIEKQDDPSLAAHAARVVKVTGTLTGGTISVSKIVPAGGGASH
jgi:hypothetical protein